MEGDWFISVDPWETYVPSTLDGFGDLIHHL